jgi:hypothetical protein
LVQKLNYLKFYDIFVATKNGRTKISPPLLLLLLLDPGCIKIRSGIRENIPDPQHCLEVGLYKIFFTFLVIKALDPDLIRIGSGLDPDPNPDPYWSPASTSGSGSVKNEYGSETLATTS